ncbi:MAG: MoaD/ThiS family protein [Myxococcales bacterium]|nr:MoaD/ThiS family protein [Myxococcales bacterium]
MSIVVRIPTQLRTLTQNQEEVTASGDTVRALVDDLGGRFPGLRERIVDDKGIRRFINVFLNDEDVRFLDKLDTAVKAGDVVSLIPAVAGG